MKTNIVIGLLVLSVCGNVLLALAFRKVQSRVEMSERVPYELLKGFLEAFNRHDLESIMGYYDLCPLLNKPRCVPGEFRELMRFVVCAFSLVGLRTVGEEELGRLSFLSFQKKK